VVDGRWAAASARLRRGLNMATWVWLSGSAASGMWSVIFWSGLRRYGGWRAVYNSKHAPPCSDGRALWDSLYPVTRSQLIQAPFFGGLSFVCLLFAVLSAL